MPTQKKKRGRPKGSKNKEYTHARSLQIPPECPNCGASSLSNVPGAAKIHKVMAGVINGATFKAVDWQRCRCDKCGQYIIVRTYLLE